MTLSNETITLCRATAPLLAEHGEAVTARMYEILFERHPHTRSLFGNAPEDQHQRLASAIHAYAVNMDNLAVLDKVLNNISRRHVEAGVRAEHYPLVGESLLQAIADVLGEAADGPVLDAWGDAYNYLAGLMIEKERALTSEAR